MRRNFQPIIDIDAKLYAPVPCIELVRLILEIVSFQIYTVIQLDVIRAFLHAILPAADNILVKLPNIYGVPTANGQVFTVSKSLYGLLQSPNLWFAHLASALVKVCFGLFKYSNCLYIGGTSGAPIYIVAYVDDLLLGGNQK